MIFNSSAAAMVDAMPSYVNRHPEGSMRVGGIREGIARRSFKVGGRTEGMHNSDRPRCDIT